MSHAKASHWERVSDRKAIGFVLGLAVFGLLVARSEPGFVMILDHANLLFHEAGHPVAGLISRRLEVYGGTLGQLTFPIILAVSFWRKGEAVSFAVSVIWFFENWLNIARYVADARTQILPLVGGGCHDWAEILFRWRLMRHDTQIAAVVHALGWIGMGAITGWFFWQWWRGRNPPATEAWPEGFGMEMKSVEKSATTFSSSRNAEG